MLPVMEEDGQRTVRHIIGFSVMLIGVSTLPTFLGLAGQLYLGGAILLGAGMLAVGMGLALSRSNLNARRLLRASIVYLPLLLALSVVDVTF